MELPHYYDTPIADLYTKFSSHAQGLSSVEAEHRIKTYGYNTLSTAKKRPAWLQFLSYFKNPLVIILLVAVGISAVTGDYTNASIIFFIILVSVCLNFYQENKSSKAAQELAQKLEISCIIEVAAGDIIPGDGKLIESDNLFINESSLTGESFPVEKEYSSTGKESWAYAGTNVVSGFAKILVIQTGLATAYGDIVSKITKPTTITAFEIGTRRFGMLMIKAIIFIVLAIFLINALQHKDIIQSIIFSLAVAVGITPELLPMIMSVNMAKGSIAMAKKGVIVKRLNAIPDFGSMDILCTDKTGTLTENKITLVKYLNIAGEQDENVLRHAYINGYFETGIKSILDDAILAYEVLSVQALKKIDELPYDFFRKRSSIIYEDQGNQYMVTKWAPEELFKICTNTSKQAQDLYDDLSNQWFRVLAIASKDIHNFSADHFKEEEKEMTLIGFTAFYDPPKQSAKSTIALMEKYGIQIKILTWDSTGVTKKVCEELHIPITGILEGKDLDLNTLNDEQLGIKAMEANIFTRLSPSQKDRIISALRKRWYIVGYLGDGINDAPSLKNADVGISVSNAVDVAKESADIILVKKWLQELLEGVIEGRRTFGNTMKYMMMSISSNFGNMFSMIGAVMYLPFFPMLPWQILLNNLLYDSSQVALPTDHVDEEYLKKPKHRNISFIRNFMLIFGPISSLFDFATFFLLYGIFHMQAWAFQTWWFIESLASQVLVIFIIRTRRIPFFHSKPSKYLMASTLSVILIGYLCTLPLIGHFFGFSSLSWKVLLMIAGLVVLYLGLVEAAKYFFYKYMYTSSNM